MATEANASTAEPMTALYVGDLDESVTEEQLRQLFEDQIGDVQSVKICADQLTEASFGYGFVNFKSPERAAKAIQDLNFTLLNGKHIRVSYSNRDPSLRKSGAGNVFVKNLDEGVDNKTFRNTFSVFGDIISSKVVTDDSGKSKGYGFVQYTREEAAQQAIQHLNGKELHGKELFVGPFISKHEREMANKAKFTNVFVKNLSEETTEVDLKNIFGEFGPTMSVAVARDEYGKSKCFGFVNFEEAVDAAKAVEALNRKIFDDKEWYVGRAEKKSERERELRLELEQKAKEKEERSLGLNNLYIKNLDEEIDDDKLRELFSPYGTIISCKVMYDPKGISKGTGFVAFSTVQEAGRAIQGMNGQMLSNKPLYVGIAEKKEARAKRMQAYFSGVQPNMVVPEVTPPTPLYSTGGPGLNQQIIYAQAPPSVLPPLYQQQVLHGAGPSRTPIANQLLPLVQQSPVAGARPPCANFMPAPLLHQQMLLSGNVYRLPPGHGFPRASSQTTTGGMMSVHDKRSAVQRPVPVEALTSALASASLSEQRDILGENLFPLVQKMEPDMAAKVTGMLLEMDQTEVLHLLESPESLRAKVGEAMQVLRNATELQQ